MKALLHTFSIAALAVISSPALSAERAFEGAHVELDLTSIDDSPSGAASSAGLGLGMTATLPLGAHFGVALGGDYMRTRVRTGELFDDDSDSAPESRPTCSFDSLGGEAALLFRLPKYFRLSAGYSAGDLTADCGAAAFPDTSGERIDTEGLRFLAEAYLGDFTLGVERLQTSLGDEQELRSTTIAGSWYPLESLKVEISGNDLYDAQTYRLMLEHQLEMLGDGFGIRAAFSTRDGELRTRTFEIGFSYYFGRKVPLQTRDRAFR
jgi:hypothetical protein